MELVIGTPNKTGFMWHGMAAAVRKLSVEFAKRGDSVQWIVIANDPYVHTARDAIVHRFLQREQASHLLFLDDDVIFDPRNVVELLAQEKEIIGGTYPEKKIDWRLVKELAAVYEPEMLSHVCSKSWFILDGEDHSFSGADLLKPVEVQALPTGFMLLHRDVLLRHENDFGDWYTNSRYSADRMRPFFYFGLDRNRSVIGEDVQFCLRMRELGEKIWVMPSMSLGHVGFHEYRGCAPCASGTPLHQVSR